MSKVNQLVLCRDNYKDEIDFKNAVRDAVMLLLDAEYIMVIDYDEKGLGIIKIEYNYADETYGDRYPCWLYPEEEESVTWKE